MFRLTVTENPYLKNVSVSPRQFTFLTLPAREILLGGAAGGGKSVGILLAALQYVTVPGYSAIIFRKTFADLHLPKALIPLSHEFLHGTDAKWDGQKYRWTFPNGATLIFGYLDAEIDKYRYQGSAYSFLGYDELTQLTETKYLYLHSRLRRLVDSPVPLRIRAATNPGGVGHQWVRDRFIDPRTRKRGCIFVPSKLEDNPWLDRDSYELSLASLDRVTRQQLRHGDWDIRPEGNTFRLEDFRSYDSDGQFYRLSRNRDGSASWTVAIADCNRFATIDVAATEKSSSDWSVMAVWDLTPSYDLILHDLKRWKLQVPQVIDATLKFSRDTACDFVACEANGVGMAVMQSLRQRGLPVRALHAKTDKLLRSAAAQLYVEDHRVHLPRSASWLRDWTDEIASFPQEGVHDDQVDTLSWAVIVTNRMGGIVSKTPDDLAKAKAEEKQADAEDNRPGKQVRPEGMKLTDSTEKADDPDVQRWLDGGHIE